MIDWYSVIKFDNKSEQKNGEWVDVGEEQPQWMIHIYFPPAGKWIAQSKEKKSNLKIVSPPIMHACVAFSPCETKGTHQGHFITRHVNPMRCRTEIDHKSSPLELCLIKVNLFHINAEP